MATNLSSLINPKKQLQSQLNPLGSVLGGSTPTTPTPSPVAPAYQQEYISNLKKTGKDLESRIQEKTAAQTKTGLPTFDIQAKKEAQQLYNPLGQVYAQQEAKASLPAPYAKSPEVVSQEVEEEMRTKKPSRVRGNMVDTGLDLIPKARAFEQMLLDDSEVKALIDAGATDQEILELNDERAKEQGLVDEQPQEPQEEKGFWQKFGESYTKPVEELANQLVKKPVDRFLDYIQGRELDPANKYEESDLWKTTGSAVQAGFNTLPITAAFNAAGSTKTGEKILGSLPGQMGVGAALGAKVGGVKGAILGAAVGSIPAATEWVINNTPGLKEYANGLDAEGKKGLIGTISGLGMMGAGQLSKKFTGKNPVEELKNLPQDLAHGIVEKVMQAPKANSEGKAFGVYEKIAKPSTAGKTTPPQIQAQIEKGFEGAKEFVARNPDTPTDIKTIAEEAVPQTLSNIYKGYTEIAKSKGNVPEVSAAMDSAIESAVSKYKKEFGHAPDRAMVEDFKNRYVGEGDKSMMQVQNNLQSDTRGMFTTSQQVKPTVSEFNKLALGEIHSAAENLLGEVYGREKGVYGKIKTFSDQIKPLYLKWAKANNIPESQVLNTIANIGAVGEVLGHVANPTIGGIYAGVKIIGKVANYLNNPVRQFSNMIDYLKKAELPITNSESSSNIQPSPAGSLVNKPGIAPESTQLEQPLWMGKKTPLLPEPTTQFGKGNVVKNPETWQPEVTGRSKIANPSGFKTPEAGKKFTNVFGEEVPMPSNKKGGFVKLPGKSEVKDITVYRGTKEGSDFSGVGGQWNGEGKYFTDSKTEAGLYGPKITEQKLTLKKPFDLRGDDTIIEKFARTKGLQDKMYNEKYTFKQTNDLIKKVQEDISKNKIMKSAGAREGFYDVGMDIDGETKWIHGVTEYELPTIKDRFAKIVLDKKYGISRMPVRVSDAIDPHEFSEILKKQGYDGAIAYNSNLAKGNEYIVFNMTSDTSAPEAIKYTPYVKDGKMVIKNAFGEEVPMPSNKKGGFVKLGKAEEPLIAEAKKYKSAEEFVKAQGEPMYHGSNADIKEWKIGTKTMRSEPSSGIYFSPERQVAENFARDNKNAYGVGNVYEVRLGIKKPKEIDSYMKMGTLKKVDVEQAIKEGYDGFHFKPEKGDIGKEEWYAIYPERIKTKSQLEQIWKEANKK